MSRVCPDSVVIFPLACFVYSSEWLPIFSQPTSSASVSLLSGLPICIATPFPRSSKAAFSQESSLIFLDRGWLDQLWADFAGFIHCVSSLPRGGCFYRAARTLGLGWLTLLEACTVSCPYWLEEGRDISR